MIIIIKIDTNKKIKINHTQMYKILNVNALQHEKLDEYVK